jgi:hypothetical protein
VPWLAPSFTWSERVGQGLGPFGEGESTGEAEAGGADGGPEAGALPVDVDEVPPPAVVLDELPHPAASMAAQVSATAGRARRVRSRVVSITVSF